ncbi:hypothetical protein [Roseovarius lutimaris]|uniref:hypothetical protein n=1 Tax=Roseovarius lutimaris TaxID=1005928 RepID=UPI000B854CAF|nr:hypothetical protein [Roseovarius lutimaris]
MSSRQTSEKITLECLEAAPWPFVLFVFFAFISAYVVAKHNAFALKDTLLALGGMKKFEKNWLINLLIAATLTLPLGASYWVIAACGA